MKGDEVKVSELCIQTRKHLKVTQAQLAQLMGCHSLTVSRWENGHSFPTLYQLGLLEQFRKSKTEHVPGLLVTKGAIQTLNRVLAA